MASKIQGTATGNLELVAGTGQSIVFTTDAEGSLNLSTMATQGYVDSQISNLIDSAPGTLDTLNELAAALGDDADFASNLTTTLAGKADVATTLAGYGITDAYTTTQVDTALADKANSVDVYTKSEVDTAITGFITETAIDTKISDNNTNVVDPALALKQDAFVTAPASSVGASGDLSGQIAFDANYIYYCTADYTDGLSDIWARTALTLETW